MQNSEHIRRTMNNREFILALRERMDKPFNFIIPKVGPKEQAVVDICCTINDRTQWVRFPLILDDHQLEFIARTFNEHS